MMMMIFVDKFGCFLIDFADQPWYHLLNLATLRSTWLALFDLTLWRQLLPHGHSYKAFCARPG